MSNQQFSRILKTEFSRRQQHNPRYSLRAFARDLELSPAAVSEVLNQKRNLSAKNSLHVLRKLGLDKSSAREVEQSTVPKAALNRQLSKTPKEQIAAMTTVLDWRTFIIVRCIEAEGPKKLQELAQRLKCTSRDINDLVRKMLKLQILKSTKMQNGLVFSLGPTPFYFVYNYHHSQLMAFQAEQLDRIKRSVLEVDPKLRLSLLRFLMVDPKHLKGLEKYLWRLSEKVAKKGGRQNPSPYLLGIQLVPLN